MNRKLFWVILLIFVSLVACAQTVVYKTSATLQWSAVTTDSTGAALLPSDIVSYDVYIYNYTTGVADPQNVALLTFIGNTTALERLITFPSRASWAAGVRTKLTDGGGNISYSAIAWSYIVADADVVKGPFLYSPSGLPRKPPALKDK